MSSQRCNLVPVPRVRNIESDDDDNDQFTCYSSRDDGHIVQHITATLHTSPPIPPILPSGSTINAKNTFRSFAEVATVGPNPAVKSSMDVAKATNPTISEKVSSCEGEAIPSTGIPQPAADKVVATFPMLRQPGAEHCLPFGRNEELSVTLPLPHNQIYPEADDMHNTASTTAVPMGATSAMIEALPVLSALTSEDADARDITVGCPVLQSDQIPRRTVRCCCCCCIIIVFHR